MRSKLCVDDWMEHMKEDFLKIEDITKLSKNDELELICFDRNMQDLMSKNKEPILSEIFFRRNLRITYIHDNNLQGHAWWFVDQELPTKSELFEFHLEYTPGFWYPLKDGKLPDNDPQGLFNLGEVPKNYREYSLNTRVGWRGPMIELKKLKNAPFIYNN